MKPCRIGITLGDVTGIGPEVTLKALAAEAGPQEARYLLIGDSHHILKLNQRLGLNLSLHTQDDASHRFALFQPGPEPLPADLPAGDPRAARAAVAWLREGTERCLRSTKKPSSVRGFHLLAKPNCCRNGPPLSEPQ
jgi:4-hydroxy-L-threonine phosphate dehydrogenase PdxA